MASSERTIWAAIVPGDTVILASGARHRVIAGYGAVPWGVLLLGDDGMAYPLAVGAAAPILRLPRHYGPTDEVRQAKLDPTSQASIDAAIDRAAQRNSIEGAIQLMLAFPGSEIIDE